MNTRSLLTKRRTFPLVLLGALAGFGLYACDEDCPDLALPAFEVVTTGVTDPSAVHVTATVTGTSDVAIQDGSLDQLLSLAGNTYDLDFTADGTAIGSIDAVCTMGRMTGCTAEKHSMTEMPQVVVTEDGTTLSVSLGRAGQCPAD
ncbi:MAG: hypothetical protein RBU30_27545 [Polyangia bacterium]|jgi:hypothetical protein|nr:hypothetical protein [Polyangia bacterium]